MPKREQNLERTQEVLEVEGRTKQIYQPPKLVEWGTIQDLTHTNQAGTQDAPTVGGTGVT